VVTDDHFWVALADPAAPGVVRGVLASLGIDRSEIKPRGSGCDGARETDDNRKRVPRR